MQTDGRCLSAIACLLAELFRPTDSPGHSEPTEKMEERLCHLCVMYACVLILYTAVCLLVISRNRCRIDSAISPITVDQGIQDHKQFRSHGLSFNVTLQNEGHVGSAG